VNEQTPKRDHHVSGVTNDQYVTPRTTLLDGHHDAHQCRDGLGARMRRHRMSATARSIESPAVYSEMSQGSAQVGRYSLPMLIKSLSDRRATLAPTHRHANTGSIE
jgi:hypothetical protein